MMILSINTVFQLGKLANMVLRNSIFIVSAILFLIQPAFSQENQLIYVKTIPGTSFRLEANANASGYILTHSWSGTGPLIRDIGVWNEFLINRQIEGINYVGSKLLYSASFEPEGELFYSTSQSNYSGRSTAGRILINFNSFPNVNTNEADFPTYPTLGSYPSSTYGQNIVLAYDVGSETLNGILNVSAPVLEATNDLPEPFSGYSEAVNYSSVAQESSQNTAMINDSMMVTYALLYDDEQTVNSTGVFSNYGDQINLLRIQANLNTNETSVEQIGSSSGSQHLLHVSASPTTPAAYRVGIVRGVNTPVSVSGAEVEMSPGDSLYHVYMTKESITGQTEWLTELYAYNNVYPDTTPPSEWINKLAVLNQLTSVVEKNDFLFVSSAFTSEAHLNDSLFYRDFMGQDHLFANYSPWFEPMPDEHQNAFSEARIHKLDMNGNVLGKLSVKYMKGQYYHATYAQEPKLFEVGDRMAWLQAYQALNDTTITYTYRSQGGSEQNTTIDLSSGKGIFILWLDDSLSILDHWVIPFENDIAIGMRMNSVLPYHGDTLIIQGVLNSNTISNLDPFDDSEPITTDELSSFFAFYSVPEIFTNTEAVDSPEAIRIYPNPTSDYIRVSGISNAPSEFIIFDLSGRTIKQGIVQNKKAIDLSGLVSGMYLLSIKSEVSSSTRKIVVR